MTIVTIHMAWFRPNDDRFAAETLCGKEVPIAEAVEVVSHEEAPVGTNCWACSERYFAWKQRHERRRARTAR